MTERGKNGLQSGKEGRKQMPPRKRGSTTGGKRGPGLTKKSVDIRTAGPEWERKK